MKNQESEAPSRARDRAVYRPAVDILETPTEVVLLADLPGLDESQVDVTLDKNVLTIRASAEARVPEGYRPLQTEYEAGDYERVFTLSDDVDRNAIAATVKDGVLELRIPKNKQSMRRKIEVVAR